MQENRQIKFRAFNKKNSNPKERMICPATIDNKGFVIMPDGDAWDIPLMQFTGLQDRNGKDIYEGDVVRVISIVKVIKYEIKPSQSGFNIGSGYNYDGNGIKAEVIGNIYEHPELLTQLSKNK